MDSQNQPSLFDKLASFFTGSKQEEQQLPSLNKTVEDHGWSPSMGNTHFSFCKSYRFDTEAEFTTFMLKAVTEKHSSHIHLDMKATKKANSILDVVVYSDDNEHFVKCLKICLHLDEQYKQQEEER